MGLERHRIRLRTTAIGKCLEGPFLAQSVSKRVNKSLPPTRISANQIMIGEMAAGIAQETTKRPPQAFIASISAAVPVIFITRFRL